MAFFLMATSSTIGIAEFTVSLDPKKLEGVDDNTDVRIDGVGERRAGEHGPKSSNMLEKEYASQVAQQIPDGWPNVLATS